MGILNTRKNKKFGYSPRYYTNDKGGANPFEIEHKFDKFRTTIGENKGLKNKFRAAIQDLKDRSDKAANRRILIIASVLIFLFLYLIDFDLSIFTQAR